MSEHNITNIIKIFARNLKNVRENSNVTYEHLSAISGIDRNYIRDCELGKCNPAIDILEKLAVSLKTSVSALLDESKNDLMYISSVDKKYFRNVPLPDKLSIEQIAVAAQETQRFFSMIRYASGINLASIIQGNNFSGIVSNVFTKKLSDSSLYKEHSEQRYPDLMGPNQIGLEVKASVNMWKGGEGHNGHSGWHIIVCYRILVNGDIEITQIEVADLIGYENKKESDWKYCGSRRNNNNSQRTETYITTDIGTAKLRDGTAYFRSDLFPVSPQMRRRRESLLLPIPSFSPFNVRK